MLNYGDVIAKGMNGILWSYQQYGNWQGDYLAVIEKDNVLYFYKGHYGSCSGCDWLNGVGTYTDDEMEKNITKEDIDNYMKDCHPFLEISKDNIPETMEELVQLLPANTRLWVDDEFEDIKIKNIFEQLKNPTFNNLDYLEKKYDEKK